MASTKKIKGLQRNDVTSSPGGSVLNQANQVASIDVSYYTMGYIDTSSAPDFSAAGYLVSQYESNDAEIHFGATTTQEVQEDLEKILIAFSENGNSLKQTRSVVDLENTDFNGSVDIVTYNL